jgi:hypothetical protein
MATVIQSRVGIWSDVDQFQDQKIAVQPYSLYLMCHESRTVFLCASGCSIIRGLVRESRIIGDVQREVSITFN